MPSLEPSSYLEWMEDTNKQSPTKISNNCNQVLMQKAWVDRTTNLSEDSENMKRPFLQKI